MGDTVLAFGKNKGRTFADLKANDPGYCSWALSQPAPTGGLKEFADYLRAEGGVGNPPSVQTTLASGGRQQPLQVRQNAPAQGAASSLSFNPQMHHPSASSQSSAVNSAASEFEGFPLAVELFSSEEFQIAAEGFVPRAIWIALNGLPDSTMSSCKKKWRFPLSAYQTILEKLRQPPFHECELDVVPEWVTKAIEESKQDADEELLTAREKLDEFLSRLPQDVQAERPIMQFQKEGILFGLTRRGRCILGDEMGLGKTLQALAISAHFYDQWPALVICPSTLRLVWRDQALQWLPHLLSGNDVQVLEKAKQNLDASAKLVIISYDLLARNEARFARRTDEERYQVVIVDESHYIKDAASKRTQCVLNVCKAAERCVLISGTPALNRACELHTQLTAVLPRHVPHFTRYAERYCNKEKQSFGGRHVVKWVGSKHREELNALLTGTSMVRRLKKDVLSQLPSKRRQRIALSSDKMDTKKLKDVKERIAKEKALHAIDEERGGPSPAGIETFKLTAESKLEGVSEYIEYLLSNDLKLLVFAHHHVMLDGVESKLKALKTPYVRIDGTTPQKNRQDYVNQFQEQEKVRVAVLSITACGTGITLTAAHTVVFAELYWVPGQMMQAEDRAHRIGQHHSVDVHYCIAEGTLDEVMFKSLNKKQRDMTSILNGAEVCLQAEQCGAPDGMKAWRSSRSSLSGKRTSEESQEVQTGVAKYFKRLAKPAQIDEEASNEDCQPLSGQSVEAEGSRSFKRKLQPSSPDAEVLGATLPPEAEKGA